jgi:hypothetical protein
MATFYNTKDVNASATTTSTRFIVPVMGDLAVDASATLITLDQLHVTMPYDDKFTCALSDALSADLIKSFVLSGSGQTFAVDMAAGATNKLAAVLEHVIDNAKYAPDASTAGDDADQNQQDLDNSGNTLNQVLGADLAKVFRIEFLDSLPNILESDNVIAHVVYSAAGAKDLSDKLAASNAAAAREIIAQQLPKSNYVAWADLSENAVASYLPLVDDQEIVFVFNVAEKMVVRTETKTDGSNEDTTAALPAANATVAHASDAAAYSANIGAAAGATYYYNTRKVAFFVKVQGLNAIATAEGAGQ